MAETTCAVVLLGPPGSGKTTLARGLAAQGNIVLIEMGNLLEEEIRRDTQLGKEIRPYKTKGELVPPEIVERVLSKHLKEEEGKLLLFDGYPRSTAQVDMLFRLLKTHALTLCGILILNVDLDTALKRISGRRICSRCSAVYNIFMRPPRHEEICDRCGGALTQRQDDRMEVVRERFLTYERETQPVLALFRKEFPELTWEANASGSPNEVMERVILKLKPVLPPRD